MTQHSPLVSPQADKLLKWYDQHARVLPWRISPEDHKAGIRPDPYRVWLSEIMLQQTTVATVKSYFERFTKSWPSIHDLAQAEREDIMKAWAGLGYYTRARNLKACAETIVRDHAGIFPTDPKELQKLPGIGEYTASAIAAIAFDKPATVVDGNVERVISRVFAIKHPLPGAKKIIRQEATKLTPAVRAGDYAQALMDLGATICTPKRPACVLCIWREACMASKHATQEDFPVKAPKLPKPTRRGWAFVAVREDNAILLRKRPDKGLLGGMTEVPGTVWREEEPDMPLAEAPLQADWITVPGLVRHTFTHFHLEVTVTRYTFSLDKSPPENCRWAKAKAIPDEALPTVMKKIIEAALPGITKKR